MERYPGHQAKVNEKDVLENIKKSSRVLQHQTDLSLLFDRVGDARIVNVKRSIAWHTRIFYQMNFHHPKANHRKGI